MSFFEKLKSFTKKTRKAFTLVETTVSLAVVACLIAVFIPTFAGVQERSAEVYAENSIKVSYDYIRLNGLEEGVSGYKNGVVLAKKSSSAVVYYAIVSDGDLGEISSVSDKKNNNFTANDFFADPKEQGTCIAPATNFDAKLVGGTMTIYLAENIINNTDHNLSAVQASHIVFGETTSIDTNGRGGVLSNIPVSENTKGETTFSVKFISSGSTAPISVKFDGLNTSGVITRRTLSESDFHNFGSETIAPTCTEQGYDKHVCSRCGETYNDSFVEALGHEYINIPFLAATCTTDGHNLYQKCNRCDLEVNKEIIEKYNHIDPKTGESAYKETIIAPTCTTDGYTVKKCSLCNEGETGERYNIVPALDHDLTHYAAVAATCTTGGWNAYDTCSRCDYNTKIELPALGHSYEEEIIAPTCTNQGYTVHTCSRCDDTYNDTYVDALGHSWDEDEILVAATCTADGLAKDTCTVCGATQERTIDKLGHTLVDHDGLAPTCTASGYSAYQTCLFCDYSSFSTLPATGHSYGSATVIVPTCTERGYTTRTCSVCGEETQTDFVNATGHSYGTPVTITNPTCTEVGRAEYTCTVCGFVKESDISATGHTPVVDSYVAATCTETGLTTGAHCSVCNAVLVAQETLAALGHAWDSGVVTVEPTCTTTGNTLYTCTRCSTTKNESIDELGHDFTSQTETSTYLKTAATCTSNAVYYYKCSRCDEKGSESWEKTNSKTGHTPVTDAAVAATCTETGLTEGSHCSVCGTVITAQSETPILGHNFNSQTATATYLKTAATCTADATYYYKCSRCDEKDTNSWTDEESALGHDFTSQTEDSTYLKTAATCTSNAVYYYKCSRCDEKGSESWEKANSKTGHTPVTDAAVAATCTTTGLTEGSHCSVCGTVITAQSETPILGHDFTSQTETSTYLKTAATCTSNAVYYYKCSRCDVKSSDSWEKENSKSAHTPVTDAAVAATCTETGLTQGSHCSVCGTVITAQEVVPASGHSWNSGTVTTSATCTTSGNRRYTCTVCSTTKDETIPALGHDYSTKSTSSTYRKQAGTCQQEAIYYYKCSRCTASSKNDTNTTWSNGLGSHSYYNSSTTEATCTTNGSKKYTCSYCGDYYYTTIYATGHTPVTDAAVAATCGKSGKTEGSHCSVCGTVITAQTTVPATGNHTKNSGSVQIAATCKTRTNGTKVYSCTVCGTGMGSESIPWSHNWSSTGTNKWYCSVCGKSVTSSSRPASQY